MTVESGPSPCPCRPSRRAPAPQPAADRPRCRRRPPAGGGAGPVGKPATGPRRAPLRCRPRPRLRCRGRLGARVRPRFSRPTSPWGWPRSRCSSPRCAPRPVRSPPLRPCRPKRRPRPWSSRRPCSWPRACGPCPPPRARSAAAWPSCAPSWARRRIHGLPAELLLPATLREARQHLEVLLRSAGLPVLDPNLPGLRRNPHGDWAWVAELGGAAAAQPGACCCWAWWPWCWWRRCCSGRRFAPNAALAGDFRRDTAGRHRSAWPAPRPHRIQSGAAPRGPPSGRRTCGGR